jgi:Tol biopolymer transport system component
MQGAVARAAIAALVAVAFLLAPAGAQATFPGTNGKIAFVSARDGFPSDADLYTMGYDGSNQTRITSLDHDETSPAWSPSGTKLVFQQDPGVHPEIWSANADGSARVQLTNNSANDTHPAWSYTGAKIVFASDRDADPGVFDLFVMNADGTNQVNITNTPAVNEDYPSWSPDGFKIAFSRDGDIYTIAPNGSNLVPLTQTEAVEIEPDWSPSAAQIAYRTTYNVPDAIWKMNADGSAQTDLTNNGTVVHEHPSWSPRGDRIAFTRSPFGKSEVFTMNPDGSGILPITSNTTMDSQPAWQPIPFVKAGYPRPKGADVVAAAIVPSFRPCNAINRWHGPPLAYRSCNPPKLLSRNLTIGTPDYNGLTAKFSGRFVARVQLGNMATPADEADVLFRISLNDIRKASNRADYTGQLRARFVNRRLTDAHTFDPATGLVAGTVPDGSMGFTVPCSATTDTTVGSTCTLNTSMDAISPDSVNEKARAIWELGKIEVMDGGADGLASTNDNDMFAVQGLYVP